MLLGAGAAEARDEGSAARALGAAVGRKILILRPGQDPMNVPRTLPTPLLPPIKKGVFPPLEVREIVPAKDPT